MIYLGGFLITFLLFKLVEKIKNKKMQIIWIIISCIPLSFIAGIRAENIGTDLLVYVKPIFKLSCSTGNFFSLLKLKPDTEIGYLLLNWLISRFTVDFHVYLFVLEFIIMISYSIGIYRFKDKCSISFGMLIFCLVFYNRSLNIVRQMLAVSIIFLNLKNYFDNKNLKFISSIFIATMFHNSAVLLLPIFYFSKLKNIKLKIILYGLLISALFFYNDILQILINLGILNFKYYNYIDKFSISFTFNIGEEFLRVFFIILLYLFRYSNLMEKKYIGKLDMFVIFDFILLQLGCFTQYASRITWYFLTIYVYIFSYMKLFSKKKNIMTMILCIGLLLYWWWSFIYCGYGETYPFQKYLI